MPQLLGIREGEDSVYLFLERVRPWRRWPWSDPQLAALVLDALAQMHECRPSQQPLWEWDYEAELAQAAEATLFDLHCAARESPPAEIRRAIRHVSGLVQSLPAIRSHLRTRGAALLHGDVHPGNVMVRRSRGSFEVVFLDWSRARPGAPLEDVACWLQSLGFWEPSARQRHDSLLRRYLATRGLTLTPELRHDYWLAAACNGLSGALRYFLWRGRVAGGEAERARAWYAVRQWLRIMRRAAEKWRG